MPSEKTLAMKKQYVSDLVEKLKIANMGIVISYKGITVEEDTRLRKEMRDAGLQYFVVKNSMLRLASKEVGYDFDEHLHGTTAIALSEEDPIMVSKMRTKYVKELAGQEERKDKIDFHIKAGFLEGKEVDVELINEYGSLPTKEESIAKLLGLLNAPIQKMAIVVNAIVEKQAEGQE